MQDIQQNIQKRLERCVKEFENNEQSVIFYKAVRQTFDDYPKNSDKLNVVFKVAVLNGLYRTNIMAAYGIANHIQKLATKENLDIMLESGDLDAVGKIRRGHGFRSRSSILDRDFYSFATKYCHFSNSKCYPIYDHYVELALKELKKSNYVQFHSQEDLRNPQDFKKVIDDIIKRFGFVDYQQADRALWVYGKILDEEW